MQSLLFAFLVSFLSAYAAAPTAHGEENSDGKLAYNTSCRTCHSIEEGDNRLGPNLHAIIGREAGATDYDNYSSAMTNSDVEWDAETLDRFIKNPEAVVPGNNMKPYNGVSDPEVRDKIVDYLSDPGSD